MMTDAPIPYVNLAVPHQLLRMELRDAAEEVICSGRFILGSPVEEFERRFGERCATPYAVGVNCGTDALVLALKALRIGAGDEVVTVPNSYVATTTAIVLAGARPVFVDVSPDMNMDVNHLVAAITPRTKAILPVHLTGRPADMPAILEVAERYGLRVIEDCSQAVGASLDCRPVGSFGVCGCFSLHPLKTLGACGDAGVITCADAGVASRLRILRNLGHRDRDTVVAWGHNSRLDSLQAALLLVKLRHLEEWTKRRRENADFYRRSLQDLAEVEIAAERHGHVSVFHTMVIQAERRDALAMFLAERGIGTAIHYPVPIHLQPIAADLGYSPGDFPVTESQAKRMLSLPVYPELTAEQRIRVVEAICAFYR